MNEDLTEIEKVIQARKQSQAVAVSAETPAVPVISFDKPVEKQEERKASDTAGELVENAFNQAIVHKVATDESLQSEMLDIAGSVVKNKTNAIKERAEQEDKAAYFNNRKGACDCFGYDEATTGKWAVNLMNLWHNIMTVIWIVIGCFTFAPITFVAKKIKVIFQKTWLAVTLAVFIYLMFTIGIPLLTGFVNK